MKQNQKQSKLSRISSSTFLNRLRSKVVKVRENEAKGPSPLIEARKTFSSLKKRPNLSAN